MPLTPKGESIKGGMEEHYGKEKGEEVFYASKNKGTITGVDEAPVPLDPDLEDLAEGQPSNIIQQYYGIQAERNRSRGAPMMADRPFGGKDPSDCGDGFPPAMRDGMIEPPAFLPDPDLNVPGQFPDESAPPEPAVAGTPVAAAINATTGDANGGIVGGVEPQSWGTGWKPSHDAVLINDAMFGDALPAGCSAETTYQNAKDDYWGDQWNQRPLGPDQK